MSQEYSKIVVERLLEGSLIRITLNAPKGNILDSVMMDEICDCIKVEGKKRGVKLLLFEGAGDNFSFGASVEEHRIEKANEMLKRFHSIFRALIDTGCLSSALVRGNCLGGGMELATFCNFVFAKETARFGQPEIRLGVFPPPASIILPFRVGQRIADAMILTGEIIDGRRAKELGIIDILIPDGVDDFEFVLEWFKVNLHPKSASSLRYANLAARMNFYRVFIDSIGEIESLYLDRLMKTADANEGILSFLEKRTPVWKDE